MTTANAALEQLIPRAFAMGVRFVDLRPGMASARVPVAGNGNHFGVIYAGVTFTVAEVLGGGMALASFDATTHFPVVKRLEIDFLAPGRSALTATAHLDDAEVARIRAAAQPGCKVGFELIGEVVDEAGVAVARTRGDYQLRPFG